MKRVFAAILMVALLCTACGVKPPDMEPQAVSLVLGRHANFPVFSRTVYETAVYDACCSYGQVSAVVSDGQPVLAAYYANEKPGKAIDETKRRQLAQTAADAILAQLDQLWAAAAEIDLLEAIHVAVNTLRGSGLEQKTLVIVDSGLSTAGVLDFTAENLLEADPAAVVEALRERQQLPDLTGIQVRVLGLGQACGEQARPDAAQLAALTGLWTAILQAGNPAGLTVDPTPFSGHAPETELPACTPVPLVTEQLTLQTSENPIGPDPIRLSAVQFVSDQSVFLDRDAALASLEPIGAYLADHPEKSVCLAGMTASTGGTGEALSLARAQACKDLLVELGAAETQILCLGLGRSENFLRVRDLDANGQLIEAEAQKNRVVFLFDQASETMQRLTDG